mmetsp:Transcript_72317/g.121379  ORF Transcript_72317/g.121379 Transcript_72317/m.121379 type:complete len:85 (-) Transcript_72317:669-923(-)
MSSCPLARISQSTRLVRQASSHATPSQSHASGAAQPSERNSCPPDWALNTIPCSTAAVEVVVRLHNFAHFFVVKECVGAQSWVC